MVATGHSTHDSGSHGYSSEQQAFSWYQRASDAGDADGTYHLALCALLLLDTLWKINTETKNGGLEDEFPFQLGDFYVPY